MCSQITKIHEKNILCQQPSLCETLVCEFIKKYFSCDVICVKTQNEILIFKPSALNTLKYRFSHRFRYIDHGNGVLTLRIQDPFAGMDCGDYKCIITSTNGECQSHCNVDVEETYECVAEMMPEFIKKPLPLIAMESNAVVSFCTRVSPVDSEVVWSICGREITNNVKDCAVS